MKTLSLAGAFLLALLSSPAVLAFPQLSHGKRFTNSTGPPPTTTAAPGSGSGSGGGGNPAYTTIAPLPTTGPGSTYCIPGKYQCTYDTIKSSWGWAVCGASSAWEPAGSCAATEECVYNPLSLSPYCVPKSTVPAPGSGTECYPGRYQCAQHENGGRWFIDACDASGRWTWELDCAQGEVCRYNAVAGYPYCATSDPAAHVACQPGTYQCRFDAAKGGWGWDVCTLEGAWVWGGGCKGGEVCSFNPVNGSPYCI